MPPINTRVSQTGDQEITVSWDLPGVAELDVVVNLYNANRSEEVSTVLYGETNSEGGQKTETVISGLDPTLTHEVGLRTRKSGEVSNQRVLTGIQIIDNWEKTERIGNVYAVKSSNE